MSYDELKRLAHARLWAANLQQGFATESLVHESYSRLAKVSSIDIPDRKRAVAYASKVKRQLILDAVRREWINARAVLLVLQDR